jgi:hypothetical protein
VSEGFGADEDDKGSALARFRADLEAPEAPPWAGTCGRKIWRPSGLHARVGALVETRFFSDRLRQPDYLAARGEENFRPVLRRKTHGFAPLPRDRFAFIVCNRLTPKIAAGVAGKDI